MKVKILKPIGKEIEGLLNPNFDARGIPLINILEVETDSSGVPLLKFWRDRFADAKFDQCIVFHTEKKDGKETLIGEIPIHGEDCGCGVCSRERPKKVVKKSKSTRGGA